MCKVFIETKTVPKASFARKQSKSVQILIRQSTLPRKMEYCTGRLMIQNLGEHIQILLPKCWKELEIQSIHDELGHQGIVRTFDSIRARCFWPKMFSEIRRNCKKSNCCGVSKILSPKVDTNMGHYTASKP